MNVLLPADVAESLRKVLSFNAAGSYDEFEIEDSARRIRERVAQVPFSSLSS